MRCFIASDIHGDIFALREFIDYVNTKNCDFVLFLGDLYNNNTKEINTILDLCKHKTLGVRGNCDGYYGSKNYFSEDCRHGSFDLGERVVYYTHGDFYNGYHLPVVVKENDILIHGHTHTHKINEINGVIVANCGSLAQPRNQTKKCFMELTDNHISIIDFLSKELIMEKLL